MPIIFILLLVLCVPVWAHDSSDAFLRVNVAQRTVSAQWDIAVRDLDMQVKLDRDSDLNVTWKELQLAMPEIQDILSKSLNFSNSDDGCQYTFTGSNLVKFRDGYYLRKHVSGQCPTVIRQLNINYNFLFDIDAQHRVLLLLTSKNAQVEKERQIIANSVLHSTKRQFVYTPEKISRLTTLSDYFVQGLIHIFSGFDHLLFLLTLLISIVYMRSGQFSDRSGEYRYLIKQGIKIISIFTLAHAISLCMSLYGYITVSPVLVESVIAFSILFAALNILFPMIKKGQTVLLFIFGMVHGLGFATVLTELGLPSTERWISLLSFNLGIEVGQIVIAFICIPALYVVSHLKINQTLLLRVSTFSIIVVAGFWLFERSTGSQLTPYLFGV